MSVFALFSSDFLSMWMKSYGVHSNESFSAVIHIVLFFSCKNEVWVFFLFLFFSSIFSLFIFLFFFFFFFQFGHYYV